MIGIKTFIFDNITILNIKPYNLLTQKLYKDGDFLYNFILIVSIEKTSGIVPGN